MRALLIAAGLLLAAPAFGAEPPRLTGEELALGMDRYKGKRVTVTDCIISTATMGQTVCPLLTKEGNVMAAMRVGYAKSDASGRAEAIRRCNDNKPKRECMIEVTGRVQAGITDDVVLMWEATLKFPN